jgi:hypothetical protein
VNPAGSSEDSDDNTYDGVDNDSPDEQEEESVHFASPMIKRRVVENLARRNDPSVRSPSDSRIDNNIASAFSKVYKKPKRTRPLMRVKEFLAETKPVQQEKRNNPPPPMLPKPKPEPEPQPIIEKPKPVEHLFHRTFEISPDAMKNLRRVHRPDLNANRPTVSFMPTQQPIEKKIYKNKRSAFTDEGGSDVSSVEEIEVE